MQTALHVKIREVIHDSREVMIAWDGNIIATAAQVPMKYLKSPLNRRFLFKIIEDVCLIGFGNGDLLGTYK